MTEAFQESCATAPGGIAVPCRQGATPGVGGHLNDHIDQVLEVLIVEKAAADANYREALDNFEQAGPDQVEERKRLADARFACKDLHTTIRVLKSLQQPALPG